MELKAKSLKWSAGRPVAILNEKTAEKLVLHVNDRVMIRHNSNEIIAVIDLIGVGDIVGKNEIAVSTEISKVLNIKHHDRVSISHAQKPASLHLIHKKLECNSRLNKKELKEIITDITENALTEAEIAYFVSAVYECGMTLKEIADLTRVMVEAGRKLNFGGKFIVDKHSIGGVSGRITPIVVSICSSAGLIIPKTSSRAITSPAGTADAIETVCRVSFNIKELRKIIKKTNACLVWGGTLGLSPADDKLIQVEKLLNLDPEPQLLASILSKKLAVGAKYVLIDLPYGKNAKVDKNRALNLKHKFEVLGKELGIKIKCFLNEAKEPRGNGIGPVLEMIDVINVLENKSAGYKLRDLATTIAGEIFDMVGKPHIKGVEHGKELAEYLLSSGIAFEKFKQIIQAQGGHPKKFKELSPGRYKRDLVSTRNFKVSEINIKSINHIAIAAGCPINSAAGIYLHKHIGDSVSKGETIITIYSETLGEMKDALQLYKKLKPIK